MSAGSERGVRVLRREELMAHNVPNVKVDRDRRRAVREEGRTVIRPLEGGRRRETGYPPILQSPLSIYFTLFSSQNLNGKRYLI